MTYVVTLEDYVPAPRFDGQPYLMARIFESAQSTGPWAQLAQVTLTPVDTDPANPQARSFTVDNAQLPDGWYMVTFVDSDSNQLPTDPVRNVQDVGPEYKTSLHQVGAILRARTINKAGVELGTFTDETRPTSSEAMRMIDQATGDLSLAVGDNIPDALIEEAQAIVALRAAALIELSYFPEEVAVGRSAYPYYLELWDRMIGSPGSPGQFVVAVEGALVDETVDVEMGAGMPVYSFDGETEIVGFKTVM